MTAVYDPTIKPEILDLIISVMKEVRDESPDTYRSYVEMEIDLLSKPNSEGIWPEVFMIMANRTGGKTYPFSKALMKLALEHGIKFGLYCRTKSRLGNIANGIFKKVLKDCYPALSMKEKVVSNIYSEITISHSYNEDEEGTDDVIGYVLPLNSDSSLKDFNGILCEIDVLFMDEFQSDDEVSNETNKFVNIHMTVARGTDQGVRYVPVIMCSNSLSIINKYTMLFGLTMKIQSNTKFLRARGISLLRFQNEKVAENQRMSAFNMAVQDAEIMDSNIDNAWLNDNYACICKPGDWGRSIYSATLIDGKEKYGVRWYPNKGYYYINRSVDASCTAIFNLTVDGIEDIPLIRRTIILDNLRTYYARGAVRFSDIATKAIMSKLFV